MILAAYQNHDDVTKVLMDAGADVNLADENGVTALAMAAYNGYYDVVKILTESDEEGNKRTNIDQADNYGESPLGKAAACGHVQVVLILMQVQALISSTKIIKHRCFELQRTAC